MMFSIPKAACALLVVALATPATLVRASDHDEVTGVPAPAGIRASIDRAAESIATLPANPLAATATVNGYSASPDTSRIPLALPRQSRVHKSTGMIIMSLAGTAAGLAGTYYMVKMVKDQTKSLPTGQ
jgi:hypothetical protein